MSYTPNAQDHAEVTTDAKGEKNRVYRRYLISSDVFATRQNVGRYLKPGQSLLALTLKASAVSARRMQEAKRALFADLNLARKIA